MHEKVICNRSKFISKEVAASSDTNQDFTFQMPDFSPSLFKVYLHWIYAGDLGGAFDSSYNKTFLQLTKAYDLGDKLGDSAFMKQIEVAIKGYGCVAYETACGSATECSFGVNASPHMDALFEPVTELSERVFNSPPSSEYIPASPMPSNYSSSSFKQAESIYSTRDPSISEAEPELESPNVFERPISSSPAQQNLDPSRGMFPTPEPTSDSSLTLTNPRPRREVARHTNNLMRGVLQYEESIDSVGFC